MAIAATLLATINDSTDDDQYVFGSVTPSADALLCVVYATGHGSAIPPRFVPSGGSLTWEEELTFTWSGFPAAVRRDGLWVAQVGSSPSSMTITLDAVDSHGGGTTAIMMIAFLFEITDHLAAWPINQLRWGGDDVNPSSQNGANLTDDDVMLLSSAFDADNRPFLFVAKRNTEATANRTNWTELGDATTATPVMSGELQYRSDTYEAQGSATWSTSADHGEIIWEVNHSSVATPLLAPKTPIGWETASAATTSVTVGMPDAIVAGDLLIATIGVDTNATVTPGGGEGWTEITNTANSTEVRLVILAKIAAGSDALTLTLGASVESAVRVEKITDHGVVDVSADIVKGTAATGTNANPNPPSASPAATEDFLVYAVAAIDGTGNVGAGGVWWPTDYFGHAEIEASTAATACLVQVATRRLNTGSAVDPGTFAVSGAQEWVSQTLLIPPFHEETIVNAATITATGAVQAPSFTSSSTATPDTWIFVCRVQAPVRPETERARPAVVLSTGAVQAPTISIVEPNIGVFSRYFAPSYVQPATGARVLSNF